MAGTHDKILIEGIIKQDDRIISEIYNSYFPSVRQFIYKNNGSIEDSRDIFNDAILVVLQMAREGRLDFKCSLKTYVYAICRNMWLKKMKAETVDLVPYEDIEDTLQSAEVTEQEYFNFNRGHILFQKHLVKMPTTCREILDAFLEGKSFREITEEFNFENESYARKRKYRCVKMLIKRIQSDPDYKTIYDDDKH